MRIERSYLDRLLAIIVGVAVNVALAYMSARLGLPLYLDTIGTIGVSALAGGVPGILTAVLTNVCCTFFNSDAYFYTIINVLISLVTYWFVRESKFRRKSMILVYVLFITIMSSLFGTAFQLILAGRSQFAEVTDVVGRFFGDFGSEFYYGSLATNLTINLLDKSVSALIASIVLHLIPAETRLRIWNGAWRQKPLSNEEIRAAVTERGRRSIQKKMGRMLAVGALLLAFTLSWISIRVYYDNAKTESSDEAYNTCKLASEFIDADRIDDYLENGRNAEGYAETERMLFTVRDNIESVRYIYVVRPEEGGCRFIFDIDDDNAFPAGTLIPYEGEFRPYIQALLKGEAIDPVVTDDEWGWLTSIYYPVADSSGQTVCYVCTDVSMLYISNYTSEFLLKVIMVFTAFFILFIGIALAASEYLFIFPLTSITAASNEFVKNIGDQAAIDDSVRKIKALDIRTGGEVEELYRAVCKMEADMAEQFRDIRQYAENTMKMQNGLIVLMADMVESRDSDTGAHIQKTSAYVKIILDGLKRKGYYAEKLTPKFIDDVIKSAPLHDVGKIAIPDAILNKPGKLTDEEYEIMKTHTTEGKKLLDKAISNVEGESYLKEALSMAAYHHERWDGKGYPEGIHGEEIPLSARIMAVADVFDALTSPRVYKPAFPLSKALSIIEEGKGTQFDAKCVEVFLEALPEVKEVLKEFIPDYKDE